MVGFPNPPTIKLRLTRRRRIRLAERHSSELDFSARRMRRRRVSRSLMVGGLGNPTMTPAGRRQRQHLTIDTHTRRKTSGLLGYPEDARG